MVLKMKYCGRKTLNELTAQLKSYGMEWTEHQENELGILPVTKGGVLP